MVGTNPIFVVLSMAPRTARKDAILRWSVNDDLVATVAIVNLFLDALNDGFLRVLMKH